MFVCSSFGQTFTIQGRVSFGRGERIPSKKMFIFGLTSNGNPLEVGINKNFYSITFNHDTVSSKSIVFRIGDKYSCFADISLTDSVHPIVCDVNFSYRTHALESVSVFANKRNKSKDSRVMRDIESSMVMAGKKSQVAILDNMLINKSGNSARGMFRGVSGLNIQDGAESGLQLNVGSRGLDPNRSANFSVRQNGYDISADPLGYPESYYTPNVNDISEIQVVRGASSLQYGSQFGGLINFILAQPSSETLSFKGAFSYGSYNAINGYSRFSGTLDKTSYLLSGTYRRGDGNRPNSDYDSYNVLTRIKHDVSYDSFVSLDFLKYHYIEHQPGGLTDLMYNDNPLQSNRRRNWFLIDWNILSFNYHKTLSDWQSDLDFKAVGLYALRYALGYRDKRVSSIDPENNLRDLQKGTFRNWGVELRFLRRFYLTQSPSTLLVGTKYYQANNLSRQGMGDQTADPNFNFVNINGYENLNNGENIDAEYRLPNLNFAVFSEFIWRLSPQFSIIPGIRWEYINTGINGQISIVERYKNRISAPISSNDDRIFKRFVFLPGIALSYKRSPLMELYANISRNYRAVTFNDLKTVTPSFKVNPNLRDESGYSFDAGIRGLRYHGLDYDISAFVLRYGDRIGEYFREAEDGSGNLERYRDNIGDAMSYGIESSLSYDIFEWIRFLKRRGLSLNIYANAAVTFSRYIKSQDLSIIGNELEFVPRYNLRAGFEAGYNKFKMSLQSSFVSFQFTDATNQPMNPNDSAFGIYGAIPGYFLLDCNMSYEFYRGFSAMLSLQNLTNTIYITKRATGYPGPGIIPSSPFNLNFGINVNL